MAPECRAGRPMTGPLEAVRRVRDRRGDWDGSAEDLAGRVEAIDLLVALGELVGRVLDLERRLQVVGDDRQEELEPPARRGGAVGARPQREPRTPIRALASFQRLHLAPGESTRVELRLPRESFATVTDQGTREYHPGVYQVSVGGGQPLPAVAATSDFVLGRAELARD